ncbi:hypothetical protein GGD65_001909 [Bradyrhizobium sp. CIR18]|nr:hypothetical protein [Bradyrhizobium sp. CIR18]
MMAMRDLVPEPPPSCPGFDRGIQYAAASRLNHRRLWYWIARLNRAMTVECDAAPCVSGQSHHVAAAIDRIDSMRLIRIPLEK